MIFEILELLLKFNILYLQGGDMVRFLLDVTLGKGKVITKNHSIRNENDIVKNRQKTTVIFN